MSFLRRKGINDPNETSQTRSKEDTKESSNSEYEADDDDFEEENSSNCDPNVRDLLNICGIITFDSPFYGLTSSLITQTGTSKVLWVARNGPYHLVEAVKASVSSLVPLPMAGVKGAEQGGGRESDGKGDVVTSTTTRATTTLTSTSTVVTATIANNNNTEVKTSSTWHWTHYALAGTAVAAATYATYGLFPAVASTASSTFLTLTSPARTMISTYATKWAIEQAEEVRSHFEFLYPL
ncbi:hypothetical protein HK102_013118, partial [Quaeritorhiza haematococci]